MTEFITQDPKTQLLQNVNQLKKIYDNKIDALANEWKNTNTTPVRKQEIESELQLLAVEYSTQINKLKSGTLHILEATNKEKEKQLIDNLINGL